MINTTARYNALSAIANLSLRVGWTRFATDSLLGVHPLTDTQHCRAKHTVACPECSREFDNEDSMNRVRIHCQIRDAVANNCSAFRCEAPFRVHRVQSRVYEPGNIGSGDRVIPHYERYLEADDPSALQFNTFVEVRFVRSRVQDQG